MPVMVLDVPVPAWNEVVIQSVLHGLDFTPDYHRETGNTVVEITGTAEKLDQVLRSIKARKSVDLLGIVDSKPI